MVTKAGGLASDENFSRRARKMLGEGDRKAEIHTRDRKRTTFLSFLCTLH